MRVLIIIPARGGSKGIPRKNLRPLNKKPLLYYSINSALKSIYKPDVYVSTDDAEIAFFASKFGANVHYRKNELAKDETTLDPVIINATTEIEELAGIRYDLVITMQPTSPLLKTTSIDRAIKEFSEDNALDSIMSAVDDTHLTWSLDKGQFIPNYKERLNRQFLPRTYKETGGFLISNRETIERGLRIGKNHKLHLLTEEEAIDIDNFSDWSLCEYYLTRKRVVFRVTGYHKIGLGHAYNCLIIASNILKHEVIFLTDSKSQLAFDKIQQFNFPTVMQKSSNIVDDIDELEPDLVINDCLDTSREYVMSLKERGYKVVNFEDLGSGSLEADMVFNAIYPEKEVISNHFYGPSYFCCRDEFLLHREQVHNDTVKKILITFGGVDPNNYTHKVLSSISKYCESHSIEIVVVAGLGYDYYDSLNEFRKAKVLRNVNNISDVMKEADICFSSAGRTIYELALMEVPTIILAQNERELTHLFASEENGFINMGLGYNCTEDSILDHFIRLVESKSSRQSMVKKMKSHQLREGKNIVTEKIERLIEKI